MFSAAPVGLEDAIAISGNYLDTRSLERHLEGTCKDSPDAGARAHAHARTRRRRVRVRSTRTPLLHAREGARDKFNDTHPAAQVSTCTHTHERIHAHVHPCAHLLKFKRLRSAAAQDFQATRAPSAIS